MKKWLVAAILLYALPLIAQTYEWTDDNGTVNFSEDLGKVPKKYRKKAKVVGDESTGPQVTEEVESTKGKPAKEKGTERAEKQAQYGGKDEKAWREAFGTLNADLRAAQQNQTDLKARLSDTSRMSRGEYLGLQNTLKHTEYRVQELQGKLEQLNDQANKAAVPAELRK